MNGALFFKDRRNRGEWDLGQARQTG